MKIKKINIPIYFGRLVVVVAKDFLKASPKTKIKVTEDEALTFGAFVTSRVTKQGMHEYYVFLKPDTSHRHIAHEIVHLVNLMCLDGNIKADPRNDESAAYLTGWFAEQIYNVLEDKK